MQYTFEREELLQEGVEFDKNSPREVLQYALGGGLLYMPATRTKIVDDIAIKGTSQMKAICLDLEDAIGDDTVEESVLMLTSTLTKLKDVKDVPLIFIRVRSPQQLEELDGLLTENELYSVITGFNFPKFERSNAAAYLRVFDEIRKRVTTPIYFNPILESRSLMDKRTRLNELHYLQRKLSGFSDNIVNIRVGATDFCNIFGIRRKQDQTIYDIGVVSDCFNDIVNFFGQNYIISGPVWEYFNNSEGLLRELELDKLNGFFGKTAIHPNQLYHIGVSNVVPESDYRDALNILGMSDGLIGVSKSVNGDKMNEVKTHSHWAKRVLAQAQVFGVKYDV